MNYSVYHIGINSYLYSGYIGISKNPEVRFTEHKWHRSKTNPHLYNAFKKYKDQIKLTIVASNVSKEVACFIEAILRKEDNVGWNIAKGGNIPPNPKGKIRSKEHCKNISLSKLGDKNPRFGEKIVFSDEHKHKLSLSVPLLKCPHCAKEARTNGMKRWHFNNCKYANK